MTIREMLERLEREMRSAVGLDEDREATRADLQEALFGAFAESENLKDELN